MISYFFYDAQIRKYLIQFCNIFTGLKVQTGNGTCEVPEFITVPIRVGSRDRVVAALESGNTQNKPLSLPMMAAHMTNLQMNPNKKGTGVVDRKTYLPSGGVYPDDLTTAVRVMPVPYIMSLELALYASNTQQLHQMLEQLLVLFDPSLQIQSNDHAFDWTKITTVELTGINNEENYAPGADRRAIVWSLNFEMPIYLSIPVDVRNEVVKSILIRIGDMAGFIPEEVGPDGTTSPFLPGYEYGTIEIDGN